ncbi:MAG: thiamine biosynthesis protein ApbE [Alphaproteobacteria bacterium 64-11]|nr:FAD:protein FMN transferase [Alphaproteobacteria bacterium]OJU14260.1 MAG: thiamine biosynthesis protein ApbE [Alphaproteobacteria bacterium 64-11]
MATAVETGARITRIERDFHIAFHAMATPCEVRVETDDAAQAAAIAAVAEGEARRIEHKFSRYRADSVIGKINASGGARIIVDGETASLLDCADACYETSGGMFDITSGVLRRAWRFDGSDNVPAAERVRSLMPLIGWHKVSWRAPALVLPPGMELDLGGIAKEYAVDRVLASVMAITGAPVLVNFGGDLCVSGPRRNGDAWNVAIETVDGEGQMACMLQLMQGALATSGDARRFLLRDGRRYSHILCPHTGWPVESPPRSVTVAAASCVEAGITATLAMLQGTGAEAFLEREGIRAWCIR